MSVETCAPLLPCWMLS